MALNRPVLGMAAVGDLQAVDINGTPGWISSTAGYAVTWPVGEDTWAVVIGNAALATSIEVARAVEFVDGRMACPV